MISFPFYEKYIRLRGKKHSMDMHTIALISNTGFLQLLDQVYNDSFEEQKIRTCCEYTEMDLKMLINW